MLNSPLILDSQEVEDLFSPVVDHILELVAEQIQSVENEGQSIDVGWPTPVAASVLPSTANTVAN